MKNTNIVQKSVLVAATTAAMLLPLVSHGQARVRGIKGLILSAHDIINTLIGIVASCALLFFIWGLAKFILHVSGDEGAVEEGKDLMKWGLVALFVMMSIWGIVNFLVDASGLYQQAGPGGQTVNETLSGQEHTGVNPLIPL